MELSNGLPKTLKSFTLCLWINIAYLRGNDSSFLSVGNSTHPSLLNGLIKDDNDGGLEIGLWKYHPEIVDYVSVKLRNYNFGSWHHYCFVFTNFKQFPFPGGNVNLTNKVYYDGYFSDSKSKSILKRTYVTIPRGAKFTIGQSFDYDSSKAFSGQISDLSIWVRRNEIIDFCLTLSTICF